MYHLLSTMRERSSTSRVSAEGCLVFMISHRGSPVATWRASFGFRCRHGRVMVGGHVGGVAVRELIGVGCVFAVHVSVRRGARLGVGAALASHKRTLR